MITPRQLTFGSRLVLLGALVVLAVLMLGPFAGLEKQIFLTDKQAHFAAFYGLAALSFVAFPRLRRGDMCMILVVIGGALEVLQSQFGRDMDVTDVIADALGVYAVFVPGWIEQIRRLGRENEWAPLGAAWRASDRRKASRRPAFVKAAARSAA